jgi:hypothetical protein
MAVPEETRRALRFVGAAFSEPIMELVNATFGAGPPLTPQVRLVFSLYSPQLTVTREIPKVCNTLRRDAINDD